MSKKYGFVVSNVKGLMIPLNSDGFTVETSVQQNKLAKSQTLSRHAHSNETMDRYHHLDLAMKQVRTSSSRSSSSSKWYSSLCSACLSIFHASAFKCGSIISLVRTNAASRSPMLLAISALSSLASMLNAPMYGKIYQTA